MVKFAVPKSEKVFVFWKLGGKPSRHRSGQIIINLRRVRLRTRQVFPSNAMQHRVGGSVLVSALDQLVCQPDEQFPNVRVRFVKRFEFLYERGVHNF